MAITGTRINLPTLMKGMSPRFVALGSFYFLGMPFVFGDDGVVVTDVRFSTMPPDATLFAPPRGAVIDDSPAVH